MTAFLDPWLSAADTTLRTLSGAVSAARPNPAASLAPDAAALTADERRLSGALMRVNHVGEVCAQALYEAQALTARSAALRQEMRQAAREEQDHLAWSAERLAQLGDRPSLLNPLWFAGAFGIGLIAGRVGDHLSLGFLLETERQVEAHLDGHLQQLPEADLASRAIVAQMRDDEARHADMAQAAGAQALPAPARWLMQAAARVMTRTAHHV